MVRCTSARCCTLSWPVRTILRLSKKPTKPRAVFHGPASEGANPARCAAGYYPAVEALDSLYSKYPNRTINTARLAGLLFLLERIELDVTLQRGKVDFYYAVDLADGSRRSENSSPSIARQYQICARRRYRRPRRSPSPPRRRWMTLFRR